MKPTHKSRSLSTGGEQYGDVHTNGINGAANGNGNANDNMVPATPSHAHPPSEAMNHAAEGWKRDLYKVLAIFIAALIGLLIILTMIASCMTLPSHDDDGEPVIVEWLRPSFPPSLADVQAASSSLQMYTKYNYGLMLLCHMLCFMFLQTFAIPGTIFFNLLGGALFGNTPHYTTTRHSTHIP
jgi:hypothetical protein